MLLVEDDVEINAVLCTLFQEDGHAIAAARSVHEAITLVDGGLLCDVVLLDFMLGEDTAESLLPRLSAMSPVPAVVLYSASPSARAVAEKWSIAFMSKPFDVDALFASMREAVLRQSLPVLGHATTARGRVSVESESAPEPHADVVEQAARADESAGMTASSADDGAASATPAPKTDDPDSPRT